jgi:hypothetical protein
VFFGVFSLIWRPYTAFSVAKFVFQSRAKAHFFWAEPQKAHHEKRWAFATKVGMAKQNRAENYNYSSRSPSAQ